jgi:hypothetical protein
MLVLGAINCSTENRAAQDHLRELRACRPARIRERLQRGVVEGDLRSGADLTALTHFYTAILDGLSVQAWDGASRKTLESVVSCAMAAWDKMNDRVKSRKQG